MTSQTTQQDTQALITIGDLQHQVEGDNLDALIAGCIAVEAWEHLIENSPKNALPEGHTSTSMTANVQSATDEPDPDNATEHTITLNDTILESVIGDRGKVLPSDIVAYLDYRSIHNVTRKQLNMSLAYEVPMDADEIDEDYEYRGEWGERMWVTPEIGHFEDVQSTLRTMAQEMKADGCPLDEKVAFELQVVAPASIETIWYGVYDTVADRILTEADYPVDE